MRKSVIFIALLVFFLFSAFNTAFAQRGTAQTGVVNIRLASMLPQNSEWGRTLDRLAAEWQRATNNQVRAVVHHGGREGSESDMLSKLLSNDIQAAVLSTAGISEICPAIMNLSVPFMIRNERELDLVLQNILPTIEAQVRNEFVVLAWSKGGWVYVFSRERVLTPDDLRRQRLGSSSELRDMNTVFRTLGFQMVEADLNALGVMLASSTVNSIYVIPTLIAPMGLHRNLNHMLEMPIAPVMGAIVMNRVTWNNLTASHQQQLLNITRRVARDFDVSVPRAEANAISAMGRDGLNVNRPSQAQQEVWQTEFQRVVSSLVGTVFDRNIYTRVNEVLDRSRSGR